MLPLGVTLRKSSREFTVASGQKVGSLEDVICPMQVKCCATPGLKRDLEIDTTFSVMDTGEELILGFPFLQSSGLLTILSATVSTEAVDETPFDSAFPSEDGGEVHIEKGPLHEDLVGLCNEFADLFDDMSSKSADVIPMTITLKENASPRAVPPRRLSPENQEVVARQLQDLLQKGIIRPSNSPYASPIVLVRKDGKDPRLCVDYTQINSCTVDLKYPLQNAKELLDRMAGKKIFASLDLKSGFHQMPLDEKSIPLTSFATSHGLFEYTRVPFGLKNAPPFFQRAMNNVLAGLVGNGCEVFIDDIAVYGKDNVEFLRNLRAVFERLRAHNLKLKRAKCKLGLQEMVYVGHLVNGDGIRLTDERKQGLLKLQPPKTTAHLRSFMGLANYMRSFVPHFSEIAKPLNRLCSDKVAFAWDEKCEAAFAAIKSAISASSVLHHLDYTHPIVLRTDASTVGIGGTLLQRIHGDERPVCYLSRAFTPAESRWSTIEQEAFAVYFCVTSLSHYLLGHNFIVETDHRNLLYLEKSVVPKLIRWRLRLQEYDFTITHIPGSSNVVADALSRCLAISETHDQVIKEVHNCVMGHRGVQATMKLLRDQNCVWPSMQADVENFVKSCATCQKMRNCSDRPGDTFSTTVVEEPFHSIAIDTVGPLPTDSEGYKYILVAVDCFSRFAELRATKRATAEEAASFLVELFGRYGAPKYLRSDQGAQFVASVIQQFLSAVGTRPAYTIAYRPQSNGIVERANGEVGRHLRSIVMDRRLSENWHTALPFVQRILNSTVHSAIGTSPSRLLFGDAVNLERELVKDTTESEPESVEVSEYVRKLTAIQKVAVSASQEHQRSVVAKRLKSSQHPITFEPGDYVLVSYPERAPSKLAPTWKGPMLIIARLENLYTCQDLVTQKTHDFHVSRLKEYRMDSTEDPLSIAQVDSDEYQVECLVEHRGKKKKDVEFRVRWKGYSNEDDSWLPYKEVRDLEALDAYLALHPGLKL
eukprot:ANDGO_04722.mRNA.1 Retrovirus-related Pol polyprotein from transposon 17.6